MYKIFLIILLTILLTPFIHAQDGISRSYYPDGTIRAEISYVNSILDGPSLFYYPNGNLKSELNYSNGIVNGVVREFYETGLIKEEYSVKEGVKEGLHRIYFENGALKEIIKYENGFYISSEKFEYDPLFSPTAALYSTGNRQQQVLEKKKIELICDIDICPVPIGGMQVIQDLLVYPEHALLYGLEGTVTLIASINSLGEVKGTEVIKGIGLGCDEAAQEAVKKTKFIPGLKDGVPADARLTINVEFKIFDKTLIAKNDLIIEQPQINLDKEEIKKDSEEIYNTNVYNIASINCDYEECAYPVYGIKSINANFVVPDIAKRLKLNGQIIVEAQVDMNGFVTDTKVLKGIGYGCDEALQSALLKTKFNPSKQNGESINSTIKIIYHFNYL